MHASMTGQPSGEIAAAVLLQASALRVAAEALAADPSEEGSLADVIRAARALSRALQQRVIDVLVDGGDVLEKMALLGKNLSCDDAAAAADVFGALPRAVGVLEQSLDAVLAGATSDQLEQYGDAMLDALPPRWRPYLDPDEDGEEDIPSPNASGSIDRNGAPAEASLETTFAVEVLDRLAACEDAALEWRNCEEARTRLEAIEADLQTIGEAFEAFGASGGILGEARRLLADVRVSDAPFSADGLAEIVIEIVDWARGQAARACDLRAFATDLVPDLSLSRVRVAASEPREGSTVDVDRVLRRLRQALRDAAASCGCSAELDVTSPALRLERAVAARVERALSTLLRSCFDSGADDDAPALALRIFRLRVEPCEPLQLFVAIDEEAGDSALSDDGEGAPEVLHGVDLSREPSPDDRQKLIYRPGCSNVVVVVLPRGALEVGTSA